MARQQLGEAGTEGVSVPGMARQIIQSTGATRTLKASESGAIVLLDSASGNVVTLPTAVEGLTFDFVQTVSVTSNASKVITASASEFLIGGVMSANLTVAASGDFFVANGSTHRAISQNGTDTGGLVGGWFRCTAISSTQWAITGCNCGSGTNADPFATS